MSAWRIVFAIATKDWRIEGRARDVLAATLFFALLVVTILAFAFGPEPKKLEAAAPGILWVAFAFASILAASRAFAAESEDGALETLLLYPVPHELIYLGKLLGNLGLMLVLALVIAPFTITLYGVNVAGHELPFALTVLLGVMGFSIVSSFQSALTINLRSRESLLPVLIFPLVVPVVIGTVKATVGLFGLDDAIDIWGWIRLLAGFNAVYLVVCTLAFPYAVE
ncbi:MAG: heme exporter protein CcmB [Deinococcales bacterium]